MHTASVVAASIIFGITFIVIMSEKLHRTIAATVGAVAMLIAGNILGFYRGEDAVEAIDFNTIVLLFSMMTMVSVLRRTGVFRYLAIKSAKFAKGNPWLLTVILGLVTAFVSMFIDNVSTVIFVAPVTILIADILGISPIPILIAEATLSNVGGVATLIGDPPNIMIGSAAGYTFNDFVTHTGPVVLVVMMVGLLCLKLTYGRILSQRPRGVEGIMAMNEQEALTDRRLLRRCLMGFAVAIALFVTEEWTHLPSALAALIGLSVVLLLVRPDPAEILPEVDWTVLVFFAGIFVLVGGIEKAGLLDAVGAKIALFAEHGVLPAALAILWISAIASSVVDNIPLTAAFIPVIKYMGSIGINAHPLWWALAFGAGFGGNGTPIGASANVVVISMSDRGKHKITFWEWMKGGGLIMFSSCLVATLFFILALRLFEGR